MTAANQEWALHFVHDAAASGRKFWALSVVDPYTRECLALEVDTSIGSRRVTRVLEGIIAERGVPRAIRSDNGPEFTSRQFLAWRLEKKIEVVHIEPGKPVQNAHVESFHGKLRDLPVERVAEGLLSAVEQWAGTPEQADDMTVIVARFR